MINGIFIENPDNAGQIARDWKKDILELIKNKELEINEILYNVENK